MPRHFDDQIQELQEKLVRMGRLAESMIQTALRVLIERNESLAEEVSRKEQEVNELQIEIDDRAVKLTALQQPVGSDVRFLFMASRIASDLERIGDQAINVCQNAHHVLKAPPLKPLVDLPRMGEIAEMMVRKGIEALVNRNCDFARAVLNDEKEVDAYRDQIFRVLLTYMMADPGTI
jgi:phosphate transport system protein